MPDAIAEVLIDPKGRAGNVTIDGNKLIYLTVEHPRHGNLTFVLPCGSTRQLAETLLGLAPDDIPQRH